MRLLALFEYFDEKISISLSMCYANVDLCTKLAEKGHRWTNLNAIPLAVVISS